MDGPVTGGVTAMTAVATRPTEVALPVRRCVSTHGMLTIALANGLVAVVAVVLLRRFDESVSAAWLALPVVTALIDALFLTATRIEVRDDREIVLRTLARQRTFNRG